MKRISLIAAIVAALALSATAIAAATTSLAGTYKTTITGKGANTLGGVLDGNWTFVLTKTGYKVVWKNTMGKTTTEVQGTYKLSGSTISITDKSGPGKCAGTGKYTIKLKGKTLTLKKISDGAKCGGRVAVLAHPFTKSH